MEHHTTSLAAKLCEPIRVENAFGVDVEPPGRIKIAIPDVANRRHQIVCGIVFMVRM